MSIELSDVTFGYPDGTLAVDGVNISVADGERVAIIGQNGAGKTTTVKLMNGLLRPTSGTVSINGKPVGERTTAEIARDVGYVFQNPDDQLFGTDVLGELEYMPKYYKWSEAKTIERVTRAARLAGIGHFLDVNPGDLPFSIKKLVAIGAVLVRECRHMILDEPTAGLDHHGLRLLNRLLDQLREDGIAVVTITHDMRFVAESFPRVVAMANRRVVADGPAAEIFADDAVLSAARVRRPEVSQLARDLGLSTTALTVADVVPLIH